MLDEAEGRVLLMGDDPVMRSLRSGYVSRLGDKLAALDEARADPATLRHLAHSLRGSGATYGFPDISTAAGALEEAGDEDLGRRFEELAEVLRAHMGSNDED